MKKRLLILPLLLFIISGLSLQYYAFDITYEDNADEVVFYASNNTKYPLSVSIDITCSGFRSKFYNEETVLDPNAQSVKILKIRKNGERYQFNYKINYIVGDFYHSRHNKKQIYQLPFDADSIHIIQGYNGKFSHKHTKALDFALPYNSQVLAARAGKVLKIVDWNTRGCPQKSCAAYANYIYIVHKDGSIASYLHLAPKSVLVKEGQEVKAGDFIAKSGNTGWSSGPHLHFEVYELHGATKKTVKTLFNINGDIKYLDEGMCIKRDTD